MGLDKKLKRHEGASIVLLERARKAAGKESKFQLRKRDLEWSTIERYLQHHPTFLAKLDATDGSLEVGSHELDIVCGTPSPVASEAVSASRLPGFLHDDLWGVENILRHLRVFTDNAQ